MTVKNEVRNIMSVSEQEKTKFTHCERRMTVKNEVRNIMSVSEQEKTKYGGIDVERIPLSE